MSEAVRQLESLYEAHGPALLAFLRRRGPAGMAEDLLHETFVQALRRLDRLAQAVSPRAYLFTIARNRAVSALRRRRELPGLDESALASEQDSHATEIDHMREAIRRLPDKLRETLELRLRDELTYEEIATVLSIPIGTVRSRLHAAVQQLRREMLPTSVEATS